MGAEFVSLCLCFLASLKGRHLKVRSSVCAKPANVYRQCSVPHSNYASSLRFHVAGCTDAPNPSGESGRPWCYVESQVSESQANYLKIRIHFGIAVAGFKQW